MTWRKNERAVEDAGPYKGLGESAPVFGGASMRAAGDAGPYGSESGAVSKFENISKRTDISTSRAGATRGGITNNIKTTKHRKTAVAQQRSSALPCGTWERQR